MKSTKQRNLLITLSVIGITPFLINGYINSIIHEIPAAYWAFELFSWVVVPIIIFTIAIKQVGLRLSEIGINQRIFGTDSIPLLLVVCIIFCPLYLLVYKSSFTFFSSLFPSDPYFTYKTVTPEEGALRIIVVIYFGLSAGIVEELYFRGLMYKISSFFSSPAVIYIICSPIAFALIHWEGGMANILATYITGAFAVLAFLLMRNLWPLIIGHIYTDFIWFS